jgi:hypothetical protein
MFVVVGGLAAIAMFCIWGGGLALHVFTIVIAYQASGLGAAVLSAVFPPFSEAYWFFKMWYETGTFLNGYSVWVLALLVVFAIGGGCMLVAAKLEETKSAVPAP